MRVGAILAREPIEQQSIRARCVHPHGTHVPFTTADLEQSIAQRFEQRVRQDPAALAVQSGTESWSYADLDRMANRVAHAILAQRGEGPEPVALLFEHGAWFIAAILGVLKAGKFYVPLDPSSPGARLRYMLEDSQSVLLLIRRKDLALARRLARPACRLLAIEDLPSAAGDESPGLAIAADALAYVIYTSGSTGQPKGVVQTQRNVLHKVMVGTNDFHLCPQDRRTLLYSPSSSGSVWEIFSSVLNGGSVHAFAGADASTGGVAAWLRRHDITIFSAVPTVFRQLVDTLTGAETFPGLRLVILGGDAVAKRDVDALRAHFPAECILASTLAATEAGTFLRYFVDRATRIADNVVPAGHPPDGKEVSLQDDEGREVGVGQVGEIVVRSRYMATGYWRRPELTRAKFLPDPAGGHAVLYRTGDLARLLADGRLQLMGRTDSQVKVRGHRVEIAEVELALAGVDNVKEAVVALRADATGEPCLVAYVVPLARPAPTASAMRGALAGALPGHMLPSVFVVLDALPLTPAGKVDRHALPEPGRARPELATAYVAPGSDLEVSLAEIWAEVVGLAHVGIRDNFLDLGGNSLHATRIVSRVIGTLRVDLPLQTLFDAPTVAEMAAVVARHQAQAPIPARAPPPA